MLGSILLSVRTSQYFSVSHQGEFVIIEFFRLKNLLVLQIETMKRVSKDKLTIPVWSYTELSW